MIDCMFLMTEKIIKSIGKKGEVNVIVKGQLIFGPMQMAKILKKHTFRSCGAAPCRVVVQKLLMGSSILMILQMLLNVPFIDVHFDMDHIYPFGRFQNQSKFLYSLHIVVLFNCMYFPNE